MAGKAKPTVKKLGVKKPTVKKPTVKKPTTAAKKPGVKKPTAAKKKPATGAKFNINKLIMLIARGAPKKSNKMTGGYKADRISSLTKLIEDFIEASYDRIKQRAFAQTTTGGAGGAGATVNLNNDVFVAVEAAITEKSTQPLTTVTARDSLIEMLATIAIPNLGNTIAAAAAPNFIATESGLVNVLEPVPTVARGGTDFDKRVFDVNYMIIVITLCKVRQLFIREIQ